MWAHYCYLLMLPALAAVAAERLGLGMKFAEVVVIVGIGPVFMYALFLATGYTLPNSLPILSLQQMRQVAQVLLL